MTDNRNFFWSDETTNKIADLIQEGMWQDDGPASIAGEVLVELLSDVRHALADEYDRGYETALDMEDIRPDE